MQNHLKGVKRRLKKGINHRKKCRRFHYKKILNSYTLTAPQTKLKGKQLIENNVSHIHNKYHKR